MKTHRIMKAFLHVLALLALTTAAQAKLQVVSTLADFAAIARVVGGSQIEVASLAKGTEDAHFMDARPSMARVLNQADVLLESGAELEAGWLPPLLQTARNAKILPGQPCHVRMCAGLHLLEVPTGPVDRSMGDVHPAGNPHYWLDPANGALMAQQLAAVFGRLDPPHAGHYQSNCAAFGATLQARIAAWTNQAAALRGVKVLTYHKSYEYLIRWLGLEVVGQLEPRPGLEPSPAHINSLIKQTKGSGVKFILLEPFRPRRTAETVAQAIGARVVVLPEKTGAHEKAGDYLALFDYNVQLLSDALKARP